MERQEREHVFDTSASDEELLEQWQDPAGAWSDLPDDMLEELDRLRHACPPTEELEDNDL
jgi:hypothetical protein